MIRAALAPTLLALAFAVPAPAARAQQIMALVRAGDWTGADAIAANAADPVARKLIASWRMLAPRGPGALGAPGAAEIAAFMTANPDWPSQGNLARRRDEAVAGEPDDATAARQCDGAKPAVLLAVARLRCADAYAHLGRPADAAALLRLAWIEGPSDADWEARFMQRRPPGIRRDEQRARFDRLAWTDPAGARRQLARLDAADKPAAETRLALRRDDASALALAAALPPEARDAPGMFLDRARWLRRAGQDDDAIALWRDGGAAAERAAPSERRAAFWDERNLLARRKLRLGDAATAYALVADTGQTGVEQVADAAFLAGFIALRRLNDPALAERHFSELARISKAAITLARAGYWRGRAAAARNDATGAESFYQTAAAYPNTYYGQLAILQLGDGDRLGARIVASSEPEANAGQALAFAERDLARAAAMVVAWGESYRAAPFLLRLGEEARDGAGRALAARFASNLGLANIAVAIARRAGRDGTALLRDGWPIAADIPPEAGVDPAFALGIIRQESSFEAGVISPAGARGLMQLMPATAGEVSRQLGLPASIPALTADPLYNMRLGTAYLRRMLDQFDGSMPMAAAAYNAGPKRVADWIAGFGDPRISPGDPGAADVIDWIELIPINETRNYVQRVIENTVIYRAERGQPDPHPLSRWLR